VFPLQMLAVGEVSVVYALSAGNAMEEPSPVEAVECCHSRCDALSVLKHVKYSGLRILVEVPRSLSLDTSGFLNSG